MSKWNPVLQEHGESQLDRTITVPEMLTFELWKAASEAKIGDTNLTIADWIGTYTREDLEAVGIPWPQSPWDRDYELSQNLQELLIRTLWNAIIDKIKKGSLK